MSFTSYRPPALRDLSFRDVASEQIASKNITPGIIRVISNFMVLHLLIVLYFRD